MGEASAGNGSQTPFFTSLLPALARQECVRVCGGFGRGLPGGQRRRRWRGGRMKRKATVANGRRITAGAV